jgi:hypothetical protein
MYDHMIDDSSSHHHHSHHQYYWVSSSLLIIYFIIITEFIFIINILITIIIIINIITFINNNWSTLLLSLLISWLLLSSSSSSSLPSWSVSHQYSQLSPFWIKQHIYHFLSYHRVDWAAHEKYLVDQYTNRCKHRFYNSRSFQVLRGSIFSNIIK